MFQEHSGNQKLLTGTTLKLFLFSIRSAKKRKKNIGSVIVFHIIIDSQSQLFHNNCLKSCLWVLFLCVLLAQRSSAAAVFLNID